MADRREALLFLLCPGGCRRFIGVRGWAPSSGPSGFRKWMPSPSGPFRRFSVPPLAGLEGQGCGDWVVVVLRLGYCLPFLGTPHVPLFPSQCPISIPGLLWRNILGLGCQGCSGACSTPFSRLLQPSVSSVVDLGVMAFGHHRLPSHSLCDVSHFQFGVHSVCAPVSKSGDWLASFDLRKRIFQCRFILLLVPFFASCYVTRSTSSKLCALASPQLRRSSPGSWLLFQL